MGALEFVSSIVDSLAWPVAAVLAAVVLRKPIAEWLRSATIKRVKVGPTGLELETWDETLREVKAELAVGHSVTASAGEIPLPERGAALEEFAEEMRKLAAIAPAAAVLESYSRFEALLRASVAERDDEHLRYGSVRSLARRAAALGLLNAAEVAAVDDVAVLRNAVAHNRSEAVDEARALEFVAIIRQLMIALLLQGPFDDLVVI